MKNVTGVTVQQKNKDRSNVYIDGEYYCSLSNVTVVSYGIKPGVQIEDDDFERILDEDGASLSFEKGLSYISRYQKTKKQVLDYLMKKGFAYPVAFKAVEKLESYGYVNDDDFAENFVSSNKATKGKKLIFHQLLLKGVSEKCADKAINEHFGDETDACDALAEKFMRGREKTFENFGKCYRHLLSKGFSYDAASGAINKLKNDY